MIIFIVNEYAPFDYSANLSLLRVPDYFYENITTILQQKIISVKEKKRRKKHLYLILLSYKIQTIRCKGDLKKRCSHLSFLRRGTF